MKLFKIIVLALFMPVLYAGIDFHIKFTPQSYWYGKAYAEDPQISYEMCFDAIQDLNLLSPQDLYLFLNGDLTEFTSKFWDSVKNNKIDERINREMLDKVSSLQSSIRKYDIIFEKIKKFWGESRNVQLYGFHSPMDEHAGKMYGFSLSNVCTDSSVISIYLMYDPPVSSSKVTLQDRLGVIAHEFSHAMCDSVFGRENFENKTRDFNSKNSVVAGWYLNEAIAIVLGNGLFREYAFENKIDLSKEEYCVHGFAPALYPLIKTYFVNDESIDANFFRSAVDIFDQLFPNGYKDPNICLYKVMVICPKNISAYDVQKKLSDTVTISSFEYFYFSELDSAAKASILQSNSSVIVLFESKSQLEELERILPQLRGCKQNCIVCQDKRIYIILQVDQGRTWQSRLDDLFKS